MRAVKLANSHIVDEHYIRAAVYPHCAPAVLSDELLDRLGFSRIIESDPVAHEPWQYMVETIELINGQYRQVLTPTDKPEQEALSARRQHIAAKRYLVEISGTTIGEVPIPTDRHTQQVLSAMYTMAITNPNYVIDHFKTSMGFMPLNAQQIQAIAIAVHDHVQAAFAREAELTDMLESGELVSGHDW